MNAEPYSFFDILVKKYSNKMRDINRTKPTIEKLE